MPRMHTCEAEKMTARAEVREAIRSIARVCVDRGEYPDDKQLDAWARSLVSPLDSAPVPDEGRELVAVPKGWRFEPALVGSDRCPNPDCDYEAIVRVTSSTAPAIIVCTKCGFSNGYLPPAPVLQAFDGLGGHPPESEGDDVGS